MGLQNEVAPYTQPNHPRSVTIERESHLVDNQRRDYFCVEQWTDAGYKKLKYTNGQVALREAGALIGVDIPGDRYDRMDPKNMTAELHRRMR